MSSFSRVKWHVSSPHPTLWKQSMGISEFFSLKYFVNLEVEQLWIIPPHSYYLGCSVSRVFNSFSAEWYFSSHHCLLNALDILVEMCLHNLIDKDGCFSFLFFLVKKQQRKWNPPKTSIRKWQQQHPCTAVTHSWCDLAVIMNSSSFIHSFIYDFADFLKLCPSVF